ncbi:MAG: hypothetical protein AB7T37_17915 [Dehalococcoidia bacterium]
MPRSALRSLPYAHRAVAIALIVVATSLLAVPTASAKGPTHVSGFSIAPEPGACSAPPPGFEAFTDFTMQLHGDLEGCWYTSISYSHMQSNGRYNEFGREVFVGTVNGVPGSFSTVYWFNALYDTQTGAELSGGCVHPIVRGYDGLAGVSGVILFSDVIDDDPDGPIANMSGSVRF